MSIFLETNRLILKLTAQSDFDDLFALRSDSEVMKYIGRGTQTKGEVQRFLEIAIPYQQKYGFGFCSVFEKETNAFVGQAGLFHVGFYDQQPEIEIAYRLHKKFWGNGYGTELAKALIQWGFEHLEVTKLIAFVDPKNEKSRLILEKCGMKSLGIVNCYYGKLEKYAIKKTRFNLTPYQDINEILLNLSKGIHEILGKNLIGLYLFGSLTYGDFDTDSSDVDLVAIVNKKLDHHELELIKQLHKQIGNHYKKWRERLECSYTPVDMLENILPPSEPRPYYGDGIFYDEAPYGNEWIINNYLLYEHNIPLIGPDFKSFIKPIDIVEVQKACIRDLFKEWEPKINDFEWLDNSHYQSYIVMNLCRILYTVMCAKTATKKVSAEWVKNKFGSPWRHLITAAENWNYGNKMSLRNETIEFIKFTIDKIKHTTIYHRIK